MFERNDIDGGFCVGISNLISYLIKLYNFYLSFNTIRLHYYIFAILNQMRRFSKNIKESKIFTLVISKTNYYRCEI